MSADLVDCPSCADVAMSSECHWCEGDGHQYNDTKETCHRCGGSGYSACELCAGIHHGNGDVTGTTVPKSVAAEWLLWAEETADYIGDLPPAAAEYSAERHDADNLAARYSAAESAAERGDHCPPGWGGRT